MKYLIAFLLITNISFSQEWAKTELADFASIEFPIAPVKTNTNGGIDYSASDDIGVYRVMIYDLGNPRITESGLPEFYEGVISGAMEAANGEMLEKKEFKLNGIIGVEITYIANSNPQLPNLRYKRMLVANNNLINYEFWTYKENEQLAITNKDKFFDSITISNKKGIAPEKKDTNNAYDIGLVFGKVIFYLLIGGLIMGGILSIRKRNRKKNKNVG